MGDLNGDKQFNVADMVTLCKHLHGAQQLGDKIVCTLGSGKYAIKTGPEKVVTVSGGIYSTDNSPCAGIWVDRELYQTDGDISITVNNTDAQSIYARKDNWDGTSGTRHIQ